MMRRLTIALLATFLLSIGAGPAVAQSPAPSPRVLDGRIEVPEAGYAVTFPEAWTVETTFGGSYFVSPDGSARCQPLADRIDAPLDDSSTMLDLVASFYADNYEPVLIETSDIELPAGRAMRFTTCAGARTASACSSGRTSRSRCR